MAVLFKNIKTSRGPHFTFEFHRNDRRHNVCDLMTVTREVDFFVRVFLDAYVKATLQIIIIIVIFASRHAKS